MVRFMALPPPQLETSWKQALQHEWSQPYLVDLARFLAAERSLPTPIYPPSKEVFSAFEMTPLDKVNVVILGQDPYHGPHQAHGLCFSVKEGVRHPPSLKNIFKEIHEDLGLPIPEHGHLTAWAKQGILLLNSVLTVRQGMAHSHAKRGWEKFTDGVVTVLARRADPVIFVLWGRAAQEKCARIIEDGGAHHFVLQAPHPSPLSAHTGFFGCCHFSKINELLKRQDKQPIDWSLA